MEEILAADSLRQSWTRYYHEAKRPCECVFCAGKDVWWNGSRHRSGTGIVDGKVVTVARFPCRRVRCADCRASWTLLPPGLLPGRHFDLAVGAHALADYMFAPKQSLESAAAAASLSSRTLRRLRDWVARLVSPATLQRMLLSKVGTPILGRVFPVLDLVRKAKEAARRAVLSAAAEVLCLLESLAAASGLPAPGLASVVSRAVRGRRRLAAYRGDPIPADAWRQAVGPSVTMPV